MKELIFIIGGSRSGKSDFAEALAAELGGDQVVFVATAEALDADMRARIDRHRAQRRSAWRTIEEPVALAATLGQLAANGDVAERVVLIDCLTLWVSNMMLRREGVPSVGIEGIARGELHRAALDASVDELLEVYRRGGATWIVVSNEVGSGIIPANELARGFSELLGRANRRIAARANRVYLMVAGLAVNVKLLQAPIAEDGNGNALRNGEKQRK